MVEQRLSEILKAASDPTRRSLLTTLVQQGPTRVTDLAGRYEMSLNSVSKHIKVLEAAGLVTRKMHGRVHLIEANLAPVGEIDRWFQNLKSIWDLRLEKLEALLAREDEVAELSLNISRVINAPLERVFNAWLDPEILAKFMTPGEGMSVSEATTEPRVGGRFSLTMVGAENQYPHSGEYKTIDRHSQIVFTWESPFSIDGSQVTLNFSEVDGGTNIELNHVIFADQEARDNHHGGWTVILDCLNKALS